MDTIVRSVFGSHLYGLNTPTSDKDFKEIFVPSLEKVILNGPNLNQNISTKTNSEIKNTAEDVDVEKFSLSTFVKHLCEGEMIAIDMMHSDPHHWIDSTPEWEYLRLQRPKFYTKNMRAYLGYIRKQVSKYSFKGSRLNILNEIIDRLMEAITIWRDDHPIKEWPKGPRLEEVKHALPLNDHCRFTKGEGPNHIEIEFYEVFGSKYMLKDFAGNVRESLHKYVSQYGKRAQLAAENEGVDWKAVSHAFRACYQLIAIYEKGNFSYPLPETDKILEVKLGLRDYKNQIEPELEALFFKTVGLAEQSSFPLEVDENWKNKLLIDIYSRFYYDQANGLFRS